MIFKTSIITWILLAVLAIALALAIFEFITNFKTSRRYNWLRRIAILFIIIAITLRPSLPGGSSSEGLANLDVYFAVDVSNSMVAEDYNGEKPRLTGVRQDIKDLATHMTGARFSIVTFGLVTHTDAPLTTDTTAIDTFATVIQTDITEYSSGSSISQPLAELERIFSDSKTKNPERRIILYLMTDGEHTSEEAQKSFVPLAKYLSGGAVLGYGTTDGGHMKSYSDYSGFTGAYIKDQTTSQYPYPDAISKIDEANLNQIASELKLPYIHRTKPRGIDKLATEIHLADIIKKSGSINTYYDINWLLAIPLVLLAAYEFWSIRTSIIAALNPRRKK